MKRKSKEEKEIDLQLELAFKVGYKIALTAVNEMLKDTIKQNQNNKEK